MQIIENWAILSGTIQQLSVSQQYPKFYELNLQVENAEDVPGFPNLLKDTLNQVATILIPTDLTSELKIQEGDFLNARVRKASHQRLFVHRDHVHIHTSGH